MPKRIQRKRVKGWKKPDGAINVSRPSDWGNPFVIGKTVHPSSADPDDYFDGRIVITEEKCKCKLEVPLKALQMIGIDQYVCRTHEGRGVFQLAGLPHPTCCGRCNEIDVSRPGGLISR